MSTQKKQKSTQKQSTEQKQSRSRQLNELSTEELTAVFTEAMQTAQKELANLVTIVLGISISFSLKANEFLQLNTLLIMGLGLAAFVFDTFGGIMFAKLLNLFSKKKVNPMIGAAGISAFPMSARVVHKMGLAEDNQNFLLMHSVGVNVSGQVASVIAGGLILTLVGALVK